MKVLVGDIETNGFLDVLDRMHIAVFYDPATKKTHEFSRVSKLQKFLDKYREYYLVGHNFICYDVPALEKLGVTVPNKIIDTLPLSFYLHLNRKKHGLASWGDLVGIEKPEVEEWENQPYEVYQNRCNEDVKINTAIWDLFWPRMLEIYGSEGKALKMVNYLNWKMHQQRIQETNKIKLDHGKALTLLTELEEIKLEKVTELESVMPKVPVNKVRNRPKKMFKMNGEPNAYNIKWFEFLNEQGIPEDIQKNIEEQPYIDGYKEPNAGSHQQVKDWLFDLGWRPETFKKTRKNKDPDVLAEEREEAKAAVRGTRRRPKWVKPYTEKVIPQILTEEKEVCPSIIKLAKKVPEVRSLEGLGVVNHRIGIVKGFIESANKRGGFLQARAHAFTNTLRLKHAELVNIPSTRKKWGKEIRSLLIANEGYAFLGSDLSSLEDRLKHHFQWDLDPEYVKSQMSDDFDPHLLVAVGAELMLQSDSDWFKFAKKLEELCKEEEIKFKALDKVRSQGKTTNYACQYGAGAPTIAASADVDKETGERLFEGYWKVNWSIKTIAEQTLVKKDSKGQKWQYNPINGFYYHLKTEKDRFSTLIQGSGSYIFDMWVAYCNKICKDRYNTEFPLCGQWHDELLIQVRDTKRSKEVMQGVVEEAITMLNSNLKLNRDMDVDVAFGDTYYEVH